MLWITRRDFERIRRQAEMAYPRECCGILKAGKNSGISRPYPCRNLQQERHEKDPDRFPRSAEKAYLIDPRALFRLLASAEEKGERITGFYHSHIDCGAFFSDEDRQRAMTFGPEPDYPEAVYLVLSVRGESGGHSKREVVAYKCFSWDEGCRNFTETALRLVD